MEPLVYKYKVGELFTHGKVDVSPFVNKRDIFEQGGMAFANKSDICKLHSFLVNDLLRFSLSISD